jgi:hypothetical protein
VVLLLILSLISLVEAIFISQLDIDNEDTFKEQSRVALTLYQMSSVFEAGIALACIVIIHNWFKESVLGTFTAIWFSIMYLQIIMQIQIFESNQDDKAAI